MAASDKRLVPAADLPRIAIVAGNGVCGGSYTMADQTPMQIYCVDGDIDDKDQSGVLSDKEFAVLGARVKRRINAQQGAVVG